MSFKDGIKKYLKKSELERLKAFKVGIAGAGGLGSNCAMVLLRSGFDDFVIADFDSIDDSNLNRQFFFENQIGEKKTRELKRNLLKINSAAKISEISKKLDSSNIKEIFSDCDIIVEAFDDPFSKKMFAEQFLSSSKFIVLASGISGFKMYEKIKVRKIRDNVYMVGDEMSEVSMENPPFAPSVVTAASIQADIVLSYALSKL